MALAAAILHPNEAAYASVALNAVNTVGGKLGKVRSERHIEALTDKGGEIAIGVIGFIECAAVVADHCNALALLVRRDGEA